MKFMILLATLVLSVSSEAKLFGKVGKCTRVDLPENSPKVAFFILTSAMDGDYSYKDDGLIVLDSMPGVNNEPAQVAAQVDIERNVNGTYTIPNDGIYGDSYTFTEGKATINKGKNATFSCEAAQ